MGSDRNSDSFYANMMNFNPRSPDGERPLRCSSASVSYPFQSTLPGWGATRLATTIRYKKVRFQSTLPGWGATAPRWLPALSAVYFNPRSPDGERRQPKSTDCGHNYFNPRSPDGERLAPLLAWRPPSLDFNPRSPDGERPRKWTSSPTIWAKSSIFNTDCIADRR